MSAATLPAWAVGDSSAPTVSDKTITPSNVSQTGVTPELEQGDGRHQRTERPAILVYQSTSDNLDSVRDIKTNGTPVGSYASDIATKDVTGLTAGTTYYINVIVKDEAGNETCYTPVPVATSAMAFAGGDGTSGSPTRLLRTAAQLAYMADLINDTSNTVIIMINITS